jgi:hypothetical protein
MADESLTVPPRAGDLDPGDVTLEAEFDDEDAEREIDQAVKGRRGIARRHVKWVRRQNPDATPAEIISMLERHYVTAITATGVAIKVGGIAADIGISLIPGASAAATGAKAAGKQAGKKAAKEVAKATAKEATKAAAKEATKAAAKSAALGAVKSGAQRVAALLPAGDKQVQFELTSLFVLAVADIHGIDYDQEQERALVYILSNGRVSQKQIATMASDLARSSNPETVGGRKDLEHWASTLADSLPGEAAQSLVRGVQTGVLEGIRDRLDGKQLATVEYGAGALVDGTTRFVFGREVVKASHSAFPDAPDTFMAYLDVPETPEDADDEPNRALEALEDAAKAFGESMSTGALAVGTGVASAADAVSRPFRSVDLDGDGVPDEPQALTAVKGVGGAIAGAAGAVGGGFSGLFRSKKHGEHAADGTQRELEAGIDGHVTEE